MADAASAPKSLASVISQLKAKRRLERDRGLSELKSLLQSHALSSSEVEDVESSLAGSLVSTDCSWEEVHGAALAASVLVCENKAKQGFLVDLITLLPALMDHEESRVRNAAGRLTRIDHYFSLFFSVSVNSAKRPSGVHAPQGSWLVTFAGVKVWMCS